MNAESSSLDITPQMAAEDTLSRVIAEHPTKLFAILLWDDHGEYTTGFQNAGLSMSQIVALLDITKARIIEQMNPRTE